MRSSFLRMITLAACATGAMLAQNAGYNQSDPGGQYEQGRGVARISVLNGDVSVRRGDSNDVVAAALNAPLLANDALLTSSSSRAEVQLDYGNVLRIGPNSEVRFTGLDVKSFQIQIAAGTVTFRSLRPSEAQAEVDTPSVSVHPIRQGIYRISVREDGSSEITVRSGAAEITSPRGTEQLGPGRTMFARGQASDPEFQVAEAIQLDNWDRWNEDRDRYLERSHSYEHVSRDVYGAEDLDQYGEWGNDSTYGSVWTPHVSADWAPYRSGRWVWEDWYGWTWVSSDPWGWAPYHYGRWFQGSAGWSWYPGGLYERHYWAPAYVGFFGYGGGGFGGGFGFGFGGLGWVPLAPFERCDPWWGRGFYGGFRGREFANRTTIINNTNITNIYANARVRGGVTGVNSSDFGRRNSQFQALNRDQVQQAGLVRGVLPVAPDRSSLRMSDRAASGNFPQTRNQNFASRTQAPRVDRVPFDQQQRGMQQVASRPNFSDAGRAGASGTVNGGGLQRAGDRSNGNSNINRSSGLANPGSGAGASGAANPGGGWQRVGDRSNINRSSGLSTSGSENSRSQSPASQAPGTQSPGSQSHGWGRFGEPIHGTGAGAAPQSQAPVGRYVDSGGSSRPASNGGWQRFDNSRPNSQGGSAGAPRNNFSDSQGRGSGNGQAVRISPPIVQQRAPSDQNPSYQSPRNYGGDRAPSYQSPSYQAPRNYGGDRAPSYQSPSYSSPRNNGGDRAPSYQSPSYQAPRNYGGDRAPSYQSPSPRNYGGDRAPSYQSPSYQSPRNNGGDRAPSYQAPRSYTPSYQAPSNGGGSRSSAPPSNGGGGGGRSSGGGGGSRGDGRR